MTVIMVGSLVVVVRVGDEGVQISMAVLAEWLVVTGYESDGISGQPDFLALGAFASPLGREEWTTCWGCVRHFDS